MLRAWRDVARRTPDTLAPEIALWSIPPLPDIPDELHGTPVVTVAGVYIGPPADAGPVLAPLRQLGTPLADMTATTPYVESQSALDDLFPDGGRYYWKSHFVDELTDELIDTLVEHDAHRPSPESVIIIRTLGGAIARVGDHETAYPHRSARFNVSVDASWHDPDLDDTAIDWARSTWNALAPFATGGVYLNFAGLGDDTNLRAAALGATRPASTRSAAPTTPAASSTPPPTGHEPRSVSGPRRRRHRRTHAAVEVAAVRASCQPIRPQADKHIDERSVQPNGDSHVGATAATGSRPHPSAHSGVDQ